MKKTIGFIGGGRITRIFLKAFEKAKIETDAIVVMEPNGENLSKLAASFAGITTESEIAKSALCDVVFIAVHPPMVMETVSKLKGVINDKTLVVSMAPKFTIDKISEALGGHRELARINPSANGITGKGLNAVAFGPGISEDSRNTLITMLSALGKNYVVPDSKIEAYAVISAMGSTYFWFQLQKLDELAVQFGMDPKESKEVITEMMNGTIDTLFFSGMSADEVKDLVPVKPLGEHEEMINSAFDDKLRGIFAKIKP